MPPDALSIVISALIDNNTVLFAFIISLMTLAINVRTSPGRNFISFSVKSKTDIDVLLMRLRRNSRKGNIESSKKNESCALNAEISSSL
jgi:hypothetical protein